jgi:two-component system chemotaxis response regulator CheB
VFKERLLGVVLTGCGSDGALGVSMIKTMGGYVLVQDEWSSAASGMPRAAIQTGCADLVLPLECIASALIALTMAPGAANLFTAGTLTNFAASSGRILPG